MIECNGLYLFETLRLWRIDVNPFLQKNILQYKMFAYVII